MKTEKAKKAPSNKKLALISIALSALICSGVFVSLYFLRYTQPKFSLRAGIVDQLGAELPNPEFNETGAVASLLRNAGFSVFYYPSQAANVSLYEKLAQLNYGIIILRTHSAQRADDTIVDLLTSEPFDPNRYSDELNNGLLTQGRYSWKPGEFFFAIAPKFIENLKGTFPRSIIVAMGCNSLNETCLEMAEAFRRKGSSAYVGWTGLVDPAHTDSETVKFLQGFVLRNETLDQAVESLMSDPTYGSEMRYFPSESVNLRLSDLMADSEASALLLSIDAHFGFSLQVPAAYAANWKLKAFRLKSGRTGLTAALAFLKP